LISGNTYDSNADGDCYVSGTIDSAVTWTEPLYRIGSLTIASGASLDITAGQQTVQMVGNTKISVNGTLIAKGAIFTWADGENEWAGIYFSGDDASSSRLENCIIEHASGTGYYSYGEHTPAAIYFHDTSPTITGCNINNSSSATGITIHGSPSCPEITGNTINGFSDQGIYVYSNTSPTITGNTLSSNTKGIAVNYNSVNVPFISGNTYDSNTDGDCYVSGTIDSAVTWTEPLYRIGSLTIASDASLDITAGQQTVQMVGNTKISVNGTLTATGATFTWADGENEWAGIYFSEDSASSSRLENCTIEHTSGTGYYSYGEHTPASIYFYYTSPTITGCTINNSSSATGITIFGSSSAPAITGNTIEGFSNQGIYVYGSTSPTITGNNLSNNLYGLYIAGNNTGTFQGNHYTGNASHGIYYPGTTSINAAYSSWGDPTGPYDPSDDTGDGGWYNTGGLGDLVSDHVNYQPWAQYAGQVRIVDNRDSGTSHVGAWDRENGFDQSFGQDADVTRQDGANFTFMAGDVQGYTGVSLWWPHNAQADGAVPVEIYDDVTLLDTVSVNQQENGGQWHDLGAYLFSGTAAVVVVSSSDVLDTMADAVKLTAFSSGTSMYTFSPGWNLMTLAWSPAGQLTAASLATSAAGQSGSITRVQAWNGAGWQTYSPGAPFGDFDIDPLQGYFVFCQTGFTWEMEGAQIPCPLVHDIHSGWNLLGFPGATVDLASSLLDSIDGLDAGAVLKLQKWDGSGWNVYTKGAPFGDFDMDPLEGFFLYSSEPASAQIPCN
jgi:parallel beta-helix repeat protein